MLKVKQFSNVYIGIILQIRQELQDKQNYNPRICRTQDSRMKADFSDFP